MIVPLGLLCLDFQGSDIGPSLSSCFFVFFFSKYNKLGDCKSKFIICTKMKYKEILAATTHHFTPNAVKIN